MSDDAGRRILIGTWVIAFVIMAYASFHKNQGLPQPVQLVKVAAVWTLLSIVSDASAKLAAVMGLGLLVALWAVVNPTAKTTQATTTPTSNAVIGVGTLATGELTA